MNLSVNNPNLSVVLPVGCNAKCKFCYWKKQTGLTLERFRFICHTLPPIFKQCSITGGEPTLCDELYNYLKIARKRFDKVVLNTNGYHLRYSHILEVDYINLSRHHFDEKENAKIFGVNYSTLFSNEKIKSFSNNADITLNCYLPDKFNNKDFIKKYINFAQWCNAKVAFRKHYNNFEILKEIDKDNTLIHSHSCGACLHRKHMINGVDVTFKYSVKETCDHMNGIYELILQGNGDLTFDWQGNKKLKFKEN
jgi:molybdenum cofactor biosynthesis enzyme MoaA